MTKKQLIIARKRLKLTSTDMAKALGFGSYRAYYRLENGDRKITETINILTSALLILAETEHATQFNLK